MSKTLLSILQLRLSGAQHVMLRVSGIVDDLIKPIQKLKGVEVVKKYSEDTLEINVSPAIDARPEIARLTIKKGFDLLELRAANLSLEEIFLQLTREDSPAPDFDDDGLEKSHSMELDGRNSGFSGIY